MRRREFIAGLSGAAAWALVARGQHSTTPVIGYQEGECRWQIGEQTVDANAGTYVFIPPGVPHNIANASDHAARMIMTVSPPGHEQYFEELVNQRPPRRQRHWEIERTLRHPATNSLWPATNSQIQSPLLQSGGVVECPLRVNGQFQTLALVDCASDNCLSKL